MVGAGRQLLLTTRVVLLVCVCWGGVEVERWGYWYMYVLMATGCASSSRQFLCECNTAMLFEFDTAVVV